MKVSQLIRADAEGDMIHKHQTTIKTMKSKVDKFLQSTDMMKNYDVARAVAEGTKLENSCKTFLLKGVPSFYAEREKIGKPFEKTDFQIDRAKTAAHAMEKARTDTLKHGGEILAVQSSLKAFVKWANWPN